MERHIISTRGKELEVYEAHGDFYKCIKELKSEGLEIITAKQFAKARMLGGADSYVSRSWSWLAESFNRLPSGNILVASKEFSPLLQYPSCAKKAAEFHRHGKTFYLNDELFRVIEDGLKHKGKVLLLKKKDVPTQIPTNAFGKYEITVFLFGDEADNYGRFLKENKIHEVSLYVDKSDVPPQVNASGCHLWLNGICYDPSIFGNIGLQDHPGYGYGGGRAFGVRAETTPKKKR